MGPTQTPQIGIHPIHGTRILKRDRLSARVKSTLAGLALLAAAILLLVWSNANCSADGCATTHTQSLDQQITREAQAKPAPESDAGQQQAEEANR